jgi:nitrous oxidase accessory protein
MKRSAKRAYIILILAFFLLPGLCKIYAFSMTDTLVVGKDKSIKNIHTAIDNAQPGDVIIVMPGTYDEGGIIINKKISLIGKDNPVVMGNDSSDVFLLNADSITIAGFTIRDGGISYIKDLAAIKVNERKGCRIENNRLYNTFFGIYLKYARNCTVKGNEIVGKAVNELSSGNSIHLWYSKNIEISDNICMNHRDGIYLEFVENSGISGNTSEGNIRYGLHFMFSNNDEYVGNHFRDNGAGVAVMFSHHITMTGNIFEHNWGPSSYGLLLKDIVDGEISGNRFEENTYAIYADGSNRIRIVRNDFTRNGWALKILGSCSDDLISFNNFEGNSFDVLTNSSNSTNIYLNNYWSDYSGYDLDRNGIGDVPYRPVKLFSYITGNIPSAMILLRSAFVDLVNFAEKVAPSITPGNLEDPQPMMRRVTK